MLHSLETPTSADNSRSDTEKVRRQFVQIKLPIYPHSWCVSAEALVPWDEAINPNVTIACATHVSIRPAIDRTERPENVDPPRYAPVTRAAAGQPQTGRQFCGPESITIATVFVTLRLMQGLFRQQTRESRTGDLPGGIRKLILMSRPELIDGEAVAPHVSEDLMELASAHRECRSGTYSCVGARSPRSRTCANANLFGSTAMLMPDAAIRRDLEPRSQLGRGRTLSANIPM